MSTEPNPDHVNLKALERFMHAFDYALQHRTGNSQIAFNNTASEEEIKKWKDAMYDLDPMYEQEVRQRPARRRLTPLYIYRYIRDSIRLRRYNESWLKNNKL